MTTKKLYHGSGKLVRSKFLEVNKPKDKTNKENNIEGVYATDDKNIAIGMALTTEKYTKSFADYSSKPFQIIFVRGKPKQKFVYVYEVNAKNFEEKPKGSHQWINTEKVEIIKREKYLVSKLNKFWRKATKEEKKYYYNLVEK